MNDAEDSLWGKFREREYRNHFAAAYAKQLVPLQIRYLMEQHGLSQESLAGRSNLTQGVISRACDLEYGNLTMNTIVRIAAGLDLAFIGRFVPFSKLDDWVRDFSEDRLSVPTFEQEDSARTESEIQGWRSAEWRQPDPLSRAPVPANILQFPQRPKNPQVPHNPPIRRSAVSESLTYQQCSEDQLAALRQ